LIHDTLDDEKGDDAMSETLEFITLRRDAAEVRIAPERGAIVTSFRTGEREWLYLDQATLNDRSKNVRGGIPLLFPTPGKLANDRWSHAGKRGELKQHGFARNLPWAIDARSESHVVLSIRSDATTLASYPWRFSANVTYSLGARALEIRFDIANEDVSPMPFALGLHPYFLVRDKASARMPTPASRAYDNVAKHDVPFGGFDFTRGEVDLHLLDHGSSSAQLDADGGTISIDCSPEFMRWVIWTLPGKDFICVEPWTAPGNALNSGESLLELAPEATYRGVVRMTV
jgi:galactose mutarotase-like enzyme